MKRWQLLLIIPLFLSCPLARAAEENAYENMVQEYRQALKDEDRKAIITSWEAINDDPQAMEYITEKYPLVVSSLRWTGLSMQASRNIFEYQKKYPTSNINFDNSSAPAAVTPRMDNEGEVARHPNENQIPNDVAVYRSLQAPSRDNETIATEYPNQNSLSNQDLIRNRLDRLEQTGQ